MWRRGQGSGIDSALSRSTLTISAVRVRPCSLACGRPRSPSDRDLLRAAGAGPHMGGAPRLHLDRQRRVSLPPLVCLSPCPWLSAAQSLVSGVNSIFIPLFILYGYVSPSAVRGHPPPPRARATQSCAVASLSVSPLRSLCSTSCRAWRTLPPWARLRCSSFSFPFVDCWRL